MKQHITIYGQDRKSFLRQEGYTLRPSGRFAALQQKVWNWAISKGLLQPNMVEEEKCVRIAIDGADLFDRIYHQYTDVFYRIGQPKAVYMGPDTFDEIRSRRDLQDYNGGAFTVTAIGEQRLRNGGRRLFDLPVTVLPYMEGCLIV